MRRRMALVFLLAASPLGAVAQTRPEIASVLLQHESVSGVPGKETFVFAVTYPPGAATGWHIHHGDEYTTIVEGELALHADGRPTRMLGAGEAYHNEAGLVHDTRNEGRVPARALATLVVDTGRNLFDPPPPGSHPTMVVPPP